MNVLIIYFSQTGNTRNIAEIIRRGIQGSGNSCDMAKMEDVDISRLKDYDLIGVGTPTFFFREPYNVQLFIKNLPDANGRHCFLFCTHGSIIGNTFYNMSEGLNKKGYIVVATFDTYSASSIQFYPEIMHTAGHPDEIEQREAEDFGKGICSISKRVQEGESGLIPKFEVVDNTWWAEQSRFCTPDFMKKISPVFSVDRDKCTLCLTCQESCPVDAIDIEADPPQLQKEGCISCWFCEKVCPEKAILADWSAMRAGAGNNLKKYIEVLKEAEKEGRFRPHVDYKKIF